MNSQYDVYMCRSIDKRKETERQLQDAELLRSIIDGTAFKFSAKAAMAMRTHNRLLACGCGGMVWFLIGGFDDALERIFFGDRARTVPANNSW